MESGGEGAVMLPLFRERGRHARTPPGSPLARPTIATTTLPFPPPATRVPLQSTPSRLRGMLIPGALILTNISLVPGDDRGVAEKTRAKMKKRKKKEKKKREWGNARENEAKEARRTSRELVSSFSDISQATNSFSLTVFALALIFRFRGF